MTGGRTRSTDTGFDMAGMSQGADMQDDAIQPLQVEHLPAVKAVIAATGLFPSELLDEMTGPFLMGTGGDEVWFVALESGTACAVAYCAPERMTEGTWNLLLIAVTPDRQGRGVGARLTQHVERVLLQRRARILLVETSGLPAFQRTRAIYRRLGYTEEARIREFYAAGEDKVVFRKALDASTVR